MLTQKQAEANLEKYGFNELTEGKRKNAFQIFIEQFKDFLVIILIAAAAVSAVLGELESAIVIAVVITINAVLGTVQTIKAENSLAGLKQLSAPHAKVIRDGSLMQIPAREVTVGDEVVIEAGDMIAADGIIISCVSRTYRHRRFNCNLHQHAFQKQTMRHNDRRGNGARRSSKKRRNGS